MREPRTFDIARVSQVYTQLQERASIVSVAPRLTAKTRRRLISLVASSSSCAHVVIADVAKSQYHREYERHRMLLLLLIADATDYRIVFL